MATKKEKFEEITGKDFADITFEDLKDIGTSGLNNLDYRLDYLENLKKEIQAGNMNVTDYAQKAADFSEDTSNLLASIQGTNEGPASLSRVSRLRQYFDMDTPTGLGQIQDVKIPFSRTEYAKLDPNVLPTEDDVNKGLIARDAIPFQRYRNPTGGGVDEQGNPIPADINLGSDRGQAELEAQRQATQLKGTLEEQKTLRDQNRAQLAQLLADRQTESFNRAIPQLTEHANTQGILRSTGFGEQLAQKYTDLTADTQYQLAQQGLGDSEKYVGGLGDIANVKAGLQTGGLQRQFSLDDASRSLQMAYEMAGLSQPSSSSGKTSGEKWNQGIQTGAAVIDAINPK